MLIKSMLIKSYAGRVTMILLPSQSAVKDLLCLQTANAKQKYIKCITDRRVFFSKY